MHREAAVAIAQPPRAVRRRVRPAWLLGAILAVGGMFVALTGHLFV